MQFDILNLVADVVEHSGVILVILGLVELVRQSGLRDFPLRLASMALGVVFGGGAIVSANGVPQDFPSVFYVILSGLLFGLIASGIVDLTGRLISKNVAEATQNPNAAIADAE